MRWALAAGAVVLIALAFVIGRISAPADEAKPDPSPTVPASTDAEINTEYQASRAELIPI